ncbi:MAG: ABC transporter permease [Acidimicrobiia bacterium]
MVLAPEETTPEVADTGEVVSLSRRRLILRRFLRRKISIAGLAVIATMFVGAFVIPLFYKWDHRTPDFTALLQGPSPDHWFGTTQTGLDVFAQTMRGLQKSLVIGVLTALLSTGTAALVGATAGYFGGWVERVTMWFVDLLLVLPSFLLLVILSPYFKESTWLLFVFLLAAFSWMITARVVRSMTLSLREREFVQAARFMGVPARKIITRHLLPNMASFLIIDATLLVGGTILAETGLSYFGFGIQPPDVSLGSVIEDGSQAFSTPYWWLWVFAGSILVLTVLSASVIGDGLRDAFDPHSSRAQKKSAPR